MKTKIHAIAGVIGFVMILSFWVSTAISELFTDHATVALVKGWILKGMFILIPAMAIAGATGMSLGGQRTDERALAKKKRMPIIALNGLLILLPSAFFLETRASAGMFDTLFYTVQVLELIAGATNLTLMGLNIRDGLTMTGRIGSVSPSSQAESCCIEAREGGPLVAKSIPALRDASGKMMETKPIMALCRCGASMNKPFCDGSHNETGFDSKPSGDRTKDEIMVFEGKEVTVLYNRLLCSHAAECGSKLKSVFDSDRKPWIVPDNGNADEIEAVVKSCPSGALRFAQVGRDAELDVPMTPGVLVEKDGPLRVEGIPLLNARLAKGANPWKYVLCRCGASKNKPYCDGTHHDIGWQEDSR